LNIVSSLGFMIVLFGFVILSLAVSKCHFYNVIQFCILSAYEYILPEQDQ